MQTPPGLVAGRLSGYIDDLPRSGRDRWGEKIMNPKILEMVPWDAAMPRVPQEILILLSGAIAALSIWFIVLECKRRKDLVPLFTFLGGGAAIVYEPLGDMLVGALYPVHEQIGWIDLFGRKIPLFIGLLYFWYMSVPAVYVLKRVEQGLKAASLWRLYAFTMLVATGIELFGVNVHAWVYYGPQSFVVFGVPLWAAFTYGAFVISISVGLHLISTGFDRRHHWLIVPAIPLFLIAGHCTTALPAAAAMFSTYNPFWIWLGGGASIALSLLLVHAVSLIYCSDSRYAARRSLSYARLGTALRG
jgi:hypothetical protein